MHIFEQINAVKSLPFNIPKSGENAIIFQEDIALSFYGTYHHHEEIQISYINKGRGTVLAGGSIHSYAPGDIIVLGGLLPHVFKSDVNTETTSHMITLFFRKDAFGPFFFQSETMKEVESFFNRARYGFKVQNTKPSIIDQFLKLKQLSALGRFKVLINVLDHLSECETTPLSTYLYDGSYSPKQGERLQRVMHFIMQSYHDDITLDDVADAASMTKNAFCAYFKRHTNKTFSRFLNEIRIDHSRKWLGQFPDKPIAEIAAASGYRNLSHFNRQFKRLTGLTPLIYRKTTVGDSVALV